MRFSKATIKQFKNKFNYSTAKKSKVADVNLLSEYPISRAFQESDSKVRVLLGALGSGKTTTCCKEILRIIRRQPILDKLGHFKRGWRFSKGAMIRHTLKALQRTAVEEWRNNFGSISEITMNKIIVEIPEEKVYCHIDLICLDKPKDVENLTSLPLTWAWINEGRSLLTFNLLGGLIGRLNRQPADNKKGYLLIDSNLCGHSHWLYTDIYQKQDVRDEDGTFLIQAFIQPSGLSDEAENKEWLAKNNGGNHKNYYLSAMKTMTKQQIETDIYAKWSYYFQGKEVYPEFDEEQHVIPVPDRDDYRAEINTNWITLNNLDRFINYNGNTKSIQIGFDYGRTPAAVICIKSRNNEWIVLKEICCYDISIPKFAIIIREELEKLKIDGKYFDVVGDPSGSFKQQGTDDTCEDILYSHAGIFVKSCRTQDPSERRQALRTLLEEGRIHFHKDNCPTLVEGLGGGFHYKQMNVSGQVVYADSPMKNKYSHVCEALEYAILGGGETDRIVKGYGVRNKYYRDATLDDGYGYIKNIKYDNIIGR